MLSSFWFVASAPHAQGPRGAVEAASAGRCGKQRLQAEGGWYFCFLVNLLAFRGKKRR
jgi:hypothetical protein